MRLHYRRCPAPYSSIGFHYRSPKGVHTCYPTRHPRPAKSARGRLLLKLLAFHQRHGNAAGLEVARGKRRSYSLIPPYFWIHEIGLKLSSSWCPGSRDVCRLSEPSDETIIELSTLKETLNNV